MQLILKMTLPALFLIVTMGFHSCDSDKFLGFNYEAETFTEVAQITGEVRNIFTGDIVRGALVKIGIQTTVTDANGRFQIEYALTEDDKLNRPVPIQASAENYLPFNRTRVMFPQPTQINIQMEYGAPIIQATTFQGLTYCQAIVLDYQGVDDVDSVYGQFGYINLDSNFIAQVVDFRLERVDVVSENLAYYQGIIPRQMAIISDTSDTTGGRVPDSLLISPTYTLFATDKSGFIDRKDHTNNSFDPDTFLFDPVDISP